LKAYIPLRDHTLFSLKNFYKGKIQDLSEIFVNESYKYKGKIIENKPAHKFRIIK